MNPPNPSQPGFEINRPTPEYAASWAEDGLPVPQRCATCAFRAGTLPNGCPSTVTDAIKRDVPRHEMPWPFSKEAPTQ